MTREVELAIRGQHIDGRTEDISVNTLVQAQYFEKNGSHYLLYDEKIEGLEQKAKNRVKLKGHLLELTRQGAVNTHMVFEEQKKHMTNYNTPFGDFQMGIQTRKVSMEETKDTILITVEYALEVNEEQLSESTLSLLIKALPDKS